MNIVSKIKNKTFTTAAGAALHYLEKDPETNIPRVMELMDRFTPEGWYEGQRSAFRAAIDEKNNWYQLILRFYELDPGVRKAFFNNSG